MMNPIASLLKFCFRHGRFVLIAGLIGGLMLPDLARAMRDWLPVLVGLLLFSSALRIGWKAAVGSFAQIGQSLMFVLIFQLAIPCIVALSLSAAGLSGPIALALVIVTAASSITGNPNISILCGSDPAPALRLLVVGTALLPATAFVVFSLYPQLAAPEIVVSAVARLLAVIGIAGGLGFLARHFLLGDMDKEQLEVADGASTVLMAVLVIALMSALGPALLNEPLRVALIMGLTFFVSFGLQMTTFFAVAGKGFDDERTGISLVAGNRNMALFLTALPASMIDPVLLFIACYQIPMYLTPMLLGRIYRKNSGPE